MDLTHFNFANPQWLWGLLLIPMGILWHLFMSKYKKGYRGLDKFVDQKLLPHILLNTASYKSTNLYSTLYGLLIFCVILALANPRWSYKEIEAFAPTASMVIALDLSSSMNATDIAPSRIIRARQYIEDLINSSKGLKIGIIGFAGFAHLVSPVTDDLQTIRNYIPALDTDLTSKQGNSLHLAFRMAQDLLATEHGNKKSILLLTDGNIISDDFSREIELLRSQNIQVHVVGIGTETGAPFVNNQGILSKSHGKIVTSKLNDKLLKDIARQGQGIYTEISHDDLGLRTILSRVEQQDKENMIAGKVRQWDDKYYWFLIPAAIILLYLIRMRALYLLLIAIVFNITSFKVMANPALDLFLNSDQKANQSYINGDFDSAASKFKDEYRRGVALYRAGEYSGAEEAFARVERNAVKISAIYNKGNAQMQQKKWRSAIDSYEEVLVIDPEHMAAMHNLEIAKKMLEHEPEDKSNDCECDKNKDDKNQTKQEKDNNKNSTGENKKDNQDSNGRDNQKNSEQDKSKQNNDSQDKSQQDKSEQNKSKQDNENQKAQDQKTDSQQNKQQSDTVENSNSDKNNFANAQNINNDENDRIEKVLSRVDSDIKIFLKNKFYVEDMLGGQ